jgi:rod shape-determining protein MreD
MKRYGFMFFFILFIFYTQNNFFNEFPLLTITPNLLIAVIAGFGLCWGKTAGLVAGLMTGLMMDIVYASNIGYYTIPYMYLGVINGVFHTSYNYDNFIIPSVLTAGSDLLMGLYIFIFSFALRNRLNFPFYLENIIIPEIVCTVVFSLVLFRIQATLIEKISIWDKKRGQEVV